MPENIRKTLKELTVLYVEDEESIRKLVNETILKDFKTVYHAGNGKKGLELFREKHPDIVMTDIHMPVMNGFEMTQKILEIDPTTPIIFTTSFDEKSFQPMKLNSSVYFFKPLDTARLLLTLQKIGEGILAEREKKLALQESIG